MKNEDSGSPPANMGQMNDPDGSASITGLCGDTMEIYFIIKNNVITESKFFTNGCGSSIAAGSIAADLAEGRELKDALGISAADIIDRMKEDPGFEKHCAILSAMTLYKAIAEYILKSESM